MKMELPKGGKRNFLEERLVGEEEKKSKSPAINAEYYLCLEIISKPDIQTAS